MIDAAIALSEQKPIDRRLLSLTETARALGISRSMAYQLASDGVLPTITVGSLRRVPVAALDDWIRQRVQDEGAA